MAHDNSSGFCRAATCHQVLGNLEHLLISCPFHEPTRVSIRQMLLDKSAEIPQLHAFVQQVLASPPPIQLQFILEPQAFPHIRNIFNCCGQQAIDLAYYLVRTFAFYIHRQRQISLGRWPGHSIPTISIPTNDIIFSAVASHYQEEDARSALLSPLPLTIECDVSKQVQDNVRTPGSTQHPSLVVPVPSTMEEIKSPSSSATLTCDPGGQWSSSDLNDGLCQCLDQEWCTSAGLSHHEYGTEVSIISHNKSHHHPHINEQLCNNLKDSELELSCEAAHVQPVVGAAKLNPLLPNDVLVPVPKSFSMTDHHVQPGEGVCDVSPLLPSDVPVPKSPSMAGHCVQPGGDVCVASPLLPHTCSYQW